MAISTISQLAAVLSGDADDTAVLAIDDNDGHTRKITVAQLRTALAALTALTGDVVAAGPGSSTATIQAGAVTLAKMADLAADTVIGRADTTGAPQALTLGANLQIIAGVLSVFGVATLPITQGDVTDLVTDLAAIEAVIATIQVPVKLGTDRTTNATGFTSVAGLALPVAASTDYKFEFEGLWQSASNSEQNFFSLTGPAARTSLTWVTRITGSVGPNNAVESLGNADDSISEAAVADVADSNRIFRITGILRNGANAGNLQVRFKTTGGTQLTVKAGSYGRLTLL